MRREWMKTIKSRNVDRAEEGERERGGEKREGVAFEERTNAPSDSIFRVGRKKILRIIYAPLVVRLRGKYAQIGYTLA